MAIRMHTAIISTSIPRSIKKKDPYDATRMRTSRDLDARSKREVADGETLLISSCLVDHDGFLIARCMKEGTVYERVM